MLMNKWHLLHLRMKFIPPVGYFDVHTHNSTLLPKSLRNFCCVSFSVSVSASSPVWFTHSFLQHSHGVPRNHICHVQCGATVVAQLARCLYYYSRLYSSIHHLVYHFSLFACCFIEFSFALRMICTAYTMWNNANCCECLTTEQKNYNAAEREREIGREREQVNNNKNLCSVFFCCCVLMGHVCVCVTMGIYRIECDTRMYL